MSVPVPWCAGTTAQEEGFSCASSPQPLLRPEAGQTQSFIREEDILRIGVKQS